MHGLMCVASLGLLRLVFRKGKGSAASTCIAAYGSQEPAPETTPGMRIESATSLRHAQGEMAAELLDLDVMVYGVDGNLSRRCPKQS